MRPRIVQVSRSSSAGGAEQVARDLHEGSRGAGWDALLAVARAGPAEEVPGLVRMSDEDARGRAQTALSTVADRIDGRIGDALRWLAHPVSTFDWLAGREDFDHPGTWALLRLADGRTVFHLHNLHGRYFDLRILPQLSRRAPVLVTMHDEWLLTGHCACTVECDGWQRGCGDCPDLRRYPALRRDGTAGNWRRKADILRRSNLVVVTPSRWLADRVRAAPAFTPDALHVVPNGVDTEVFRPRDRTEARHRLGIGEADLVVSAVAHRFQRSSYKDVDTVLQAVRRASAALPGRRIVCLLAGDTGEVERLGDLEVRPLGRVPYGEPLASVHAAADVFVHAALSENHPLVVLEALACGLPVVATGVGGIPEQVVVDGRAPTGRLVDRGDADAMARALRELAERQELRETLGGNARRDALARFRLRDTVQAYLELYAGLAASRSGSGGGTTSARPRAATRDS